ncbi:MAG TPA: succinyl-diaminopimelate desuccinylase [Acidimicrobiia bacterium]|nr:succinyl-diaminopimelate desuccinylase [Acidimicrobiia bacterium]
MTDADAGDLLTLTASLVAVPSPSHREEALADAIEERLRARAPNLSVERVGENVVARTDLGRERRVVLGGHLDTVPPNDNERPRLDGEVLHGLGSADMKGGLAVLLRLAEQLTDGSTARYDVTLAFYECEEVAEEHNGLRRLFEERPELLAGDFAVLLEPTGGAVEAGCQGTLHVRASFDGIRAHSARPWIGRNAIHEAAPVLARVVAHETDTVEVDGLPYRESLEVVRIEAGVANNVVPDACSFILNRRFAPAYSIEDAKTQVFSLLEDADQVEVLNASPAAPPNLGHPLVAEFVDDLGLEVRPKLGWTDVARFAARGVPAVNFGPGDPELAHTAGELVTRDSVEGCHRALARFVSGG